MPDRLMKVNAYTTFDLIDATVKAHEFEEDSYAVLNATSPRKNPDEVKLQLELDNMTEEHLPAHMEEVHLSPEQARELASDLEKHATKVEKSQSEE